MAADNLGPALELAANLSTLFQRDPFIDRFDRAARAGFGAVEFWWPREELFEGLSLDQVVRRAKDVGLEVALINFDAGDIQRGERGIASDPKRVEQFLQHVPQAIELATSVGCHKLNLPVGKRERSVGTRSRQMTVLAGNIIEAARQAANAGISVLVEALNPVDAPGYLLCTVEDVLRLIDDIGVQNVLCLLDVYHVASGGRNPIETIAVAGARIGHVQVADVPGRHEPGTGGLRWAAIMSELIATGYRGFVGLEYYPRDPSREDFGFIGEWIARCTAGERRPSGQQHGAADAS
jgi:hydroxypyruvate isomerase